MHYSELRIYQIAIKLEEELEKELKKIPYGWRIKEVDEARRSSGSSTTNIVEDHGRKFYVKDYIKFLDYSMASSDETQKHVRKLYLKGHFKKSTFLYFFKEYKDLAIRTLNYINWLKNNDYSK